MANSTDALIEQWSDAFGNQLSRRTRNNADLAAHYRFTPERHRFYRDGSREVIHYDLAAGTSVSGFEDNRANEEDVWILAPSAGETLSLRSAEQFRYTVNFVSQVTQAFALSQALSNTDDRLTIGLDTSPNGDLSDGYFMEQTASHDADRADIFIRRNGSVVGTRREVQLPAASTLFQRPENSYNWYNVGISDWVATVTEAVPYSGGDQYEQSNEFLGTVGVADGDANAGPGARGPIAGNGQVVYEIEADSGTSGLELYTGSFSYTTLGAVGSSVKAKGAETAAYTPSQSTDWEPVMAMRVAPDRPNVSTQLQALELTAGNGKAMVIACDPSNVLDGGGSTLSDSDFDRPEEHSGQNSVLEVTDLSTVAEFPGSDGTTGTTQANPGGYQLAFDTTRSVGSGSKQSTRSGDLNEKHGILDGDYAVLITKPADTTDQRYFYETEMDE